ncbi:SRR1-like protein isoform X2 [Nylanderia fulva]|nr:SRR1-like protein isoform X2 [Nylanderia fulva]
MSEDGFKLVTYRRRKHRKNTAQKNLRRDATPENAEKYELHEVVEFLAIRILHNAYELRATPLMKHVREQLKTALIILNSNDISEIVCYGLGRFTKSKSSRYQLAFLLCLKARYSDACVHVYDPAFSSKEKEILRYLSLKIIEKNEEGKRILHQDRTTLVFMPHCPRELMNNYLYANWGEGLSNCILLGNSISNLKEDCWNKDTLRRSNYVYRIQPYILEIKFDFLTHEYEYVFNDQSIHIFPKENFLQVPPNFWNCREEPQYLKNDETELIRRC